MTLKEGCLLLSTTYKISCFAEGWKFGPVMQQQEQDNFQVYCKYFIVTHSHMHFVHFAFWKLKIKKQNKNAIKKVLMIKV